MEFTYLILKQTTTLQTAVNHIDVVEESFQLTVPYLGIIFFFATAE